jgi:hypothetical protein
MFPDYLLYYEGQKLMYFKIQKSELKNIHESQKMENIHKSKE